MYAVICSGGKQYKVSEGDRLRVAKMAADAGAAVDFAEILAVHNGEDLVLGTPLVPSAKVTGRVIQHGRGRKIVVFRFKKRKGFHRKIGHRQDFTEIRIETIALG